MISSKDEVNCEKLLEAQQQLAKLAKEGCQPGFFGTIGVEIFIQDGEAQYIRRIVNATDK